ncbi:MAG: hypothetical protein KDD34_03670, partial [Bdellovibrionales bacterium]|nr:hypothetical protein [Bdellovibrionales bacterium]
MRPILAILACFIFSTQTRAEYPFARKNHDLGSEIKNDSQRLIPEFQFARFAIDGDTWARSLGVNDFYHGVGYWIQGRTEVNPNPFLFINVRTIAYSGSSSEGYANPTGFYNLISFTGNWPQQFDSYSLKLRIVDLERQNIGFGLLVQDREMNGALIELSNENHNFRFLGDSTGALVSGDDLVNAQTQLFHGWIGGGASFWTQSQSQSQLPKNRDPYYYITSSHKFFENQLGYEVEFGQRNSAHSGLIAFSFNRQKDFWSLQSKLEARNYQAGFGKDFVGRIEHQYVSYDQYDKAYTNAMNLFTKSDRASIYTLHLNIKYEINDTWKLESLNEIGTFDFRDNNEYSSFYFYRAGIDYCPIEKRDDCISMFTSNKVLNVSYNRPPHQLSYSNVSFFKRVDYFGFEGRFR